MKKSILKLLVVTILSVGMTQAMNRVEQQTETKQNAQAAQATQSLFEYIAQGGQNQSSQERINAIQDFIKNGANIRAMYKSWTILYTLAHNPSMRSDISLYELFLRAGVSPLVTGPTRQIPNWPVNETVLDYLEKYLAIVKNKAKGGRWTNSQEVQRAQEEAKKLSAIIALLNAYKPALPASASAAPSAPIAQYVVPKPAPAAASSSSAAFSPEFIEGAVISGETAVSQPSKKLRTEQGAIATYAAPKEAVVSAPSEPTSFA